MDNIKEGTEITCPKCNKVMIKCVIPPTLGKVIQPYMFEPVNDTPKSGKPASCPTCKIAYISTCAHTKEHGWTC